MRPEIVGSPFDEICRSLHDPVGLAQHLIHRFADDRNTDLRNAAADDKISDSCGTVLFLFLPKLPSFREIFSLSRFPL